MQAFLASKPPDKAKPYAESLVQQQPGHPAGWFFLTGIHFALNNCKGALESYIRLKQINPATARELREKTRGRLPAGF